MPRVFTPKDANTILPEVKQILRDIRVATEEAGSSSNEMTRTSRLKLKELFERLESLGCIVRDISIGLIDFPANRLGRPVFLCWKLDEPAVTHWHGEQEGFLARRTVVEAEFEQVAQLPAYIV